MSVEKQNMDLMQTLDNAWNAHDLEPFARRQKPDVVVRWPGQPPVHGIQTHTEESVQAEQVTFLPYDHPASHRPARLPDD